jgi:hypothetical protein
LSRNKKFAHQGSRRSIPWGPAPGAGADASIQFEYYLNIHFNTDKWSFQS